MMSVDGWRLGFEILQFLLTSGCLVYVYFSNKNTVTNDRIEKIEESNNSNFKDHAERISHLESVSESAPDHADISKVYDSINSLAATVNQLVGENRGQSDTLKLILNQITAKGMK